MKASAVIRIKDLGVYTQRLKSLRAQLPNLMRDSVEDALANGQSDVLADIWRRTPQSDRARYAYAYKAIELKDWKKNGSALKDGWRRKIKESNGWKSLRRLDQYGQQRLRKSIFGGQDTYGIKGLTVKTTDRAATFTISSELPYARRMHEATKIVDYWSGESDRGIGAKKGRGWSTIGTGAKFITGPVEEKMGEIRGDIRGCLYFRLHEAMSQ